jgi:hypothetical protein
VLLVPTQKKQFLVLFAHWKNEECVSPLQAWTALMKLKHGTEIPFVWDGRNNLIQRYDAFIDQSQLPLDMYQVYLIEPPSWLEGYVKKKDPYKEILMMDFSNSQKDSKDFVWPETSQSKRLTPSGVDSIKWRSCISLNNGYYFKFWMGDYLWWDQKCRLPASEDAMSTAVVLQMDEIEQDAKNLWLWRRKEPERFHQQAKRYVSCYLSAYDAERVMKRWHKCVEEVQSLETFWLRANVPFGIKNVLLKMYVQGMFALRPEDPTGMIELMVLALSCAVISPYFFSVKDELTLRSFPPGYFERQIHEHLYHFIFHRSRAYTLWSLSYRSDCPNLWLDMGVGDMSLLDSSPNNSIATFSPFCELKGFGPAPWGSQTEDVTLVENMAIFFSMRLHWKGKAMMDGLMSRTTNGFRSTVLENYTRSEHEQWMKYFFTHREMENTRSVTYTRTHRFPAIKKEEYPHAIQLTFYSRFGEQLSEVNDEHQNVLLELRYKAEEGEKISWFSSDVFRAMKKSEFKTFGDRLPQLYEEAQLQNCSRIEQHSIPCDECVQRYRQVLDHPARCFRVLRLDEGSIRQWHCRQFSRWVGKAEFITEQWINDVYLHVQDNMFARYLFNGNQLWETFIDQAKMLILYPSISPQYLAIEFGNQILFMAKNLKDTHTSRDFHAAMSLRPPAQLWTSRSMLAGMLLLFPIWLLSRKPFNIHPNAWSLAMQTSASCVYVHTTITTLFAVSAKTVSRYEPFVVLVRGLLILLVQYMKYKEIPESESIYQGTYFLIRAMGMHDIPSVIDTLPELCMYEEEWARVPSLWAKLTQTNFIRADMPLLAWFGRGDDAIWNVLLSDMVTGRPEHRYLRIFTTAKEEDDQKYCATDRMIITLDDLRRNGQRITQMNSNLDIQTQRKFFWTSLTLSKNTQSDLEEMYKLPVTEDSDIYRTWLSKPELKLDDEKKYLIDTHACFEPSHPNSFPWLGPDRRDNTEIKETYPQVSHVLCELETEDNSAGINL